MAAVTTAVKRVERDVLGLRVDPFGDANSKHAWLAPGKTHHPATSIVIVGDEGRRAGLELLMMLPVTARREDQE
jgi:hypothetical protein